jgi:asparagine synthase (glutamine-hydrolysing)
MFAFAHFDAQTNILMIARDNLGKKPLYYSKKNEAFYWSSSLDVLAKLTGAKYRKDSVNLDYLSLGYQLDPNTGYEEIFALLPGHYLEIKDGRYFPEPRRFKTQISKFKFKDSIRNALWNAIEVRAAGHDKIAVSLSGGVDSTLIALGLKSLGFNSTAFSAFWSNSDKDRYNSDKNHAEQIARNLNLDFIAVDVSKDFDLKNTLRAFLFAMEEPNNNPTGLSTVELYKTVAEKKFKLLLTGDGSDEIFGGYSRHESVAKLPQVFRLEGKRHQRNLFSRENRLQQLFANVVASQLEPQDPLRWLHWHWAFTPIELGRLLIGKIGYEEITNALTQAVRNLGPSQPKAGATKSLMQRDHQIWLSMESNRKLDRISMAFSIEARSPFQDENVIEIANRIMSQTNFSTLDKRLLKEHFPELISLPIKKEKVGFTSPIGHWMRQEPEFIRDSIAYLQGQVGWNASTLEPFSNAQFKGDYRTNMQLWTLVVYSNWLMIKNES